VVGLESGITAIAAGRHHTCALTGAGAVKCWGYNYYGQLGDGTTTTRTTPVRVAGLDSGVTAIGAGVHHTCAMTTEGGRCWGYNGYGELGDGTRTSRSTPVDILGLDDSLTVLTAGFDHTCALTSTGAVKCWGRNNWGQLGDGTGWDRLAPVDVLGLSGGAIGVAAGENHACAVTSNGDVQCWGDNRNGQLGNGTNTLPWKPVEVVDLCSPWFGCYLPLAERGWAPQWEAEPNDEALTQANGPIVSGLTYHGTFPSTADQKDYFYFDLEVGRAVELWLGNIPPGHDYDLVLRRNDASLSEVARSVGRNSATEHILADVLQPGRYYVQVYNFGRTSSTQAYLLRALY
jgi:hypothetical protein